MANTLYDILEVSPSASVETISTNFKRLQDTFSALAASGDEDAINRMIALKEAYRTLSDPSRRQQYDEGLAVRNGLITGHTPSGSRSPLKWAVLATGLAVIGLATENHFSTQRQLAEQENIRLKAEQTAAAMRLAEIEAQREREERVAAQQEEQRRRQAEAIERMEQEHAMAYGRQISRDVELAEERERQRWALAERQRQYEADRQLAREKAYLRQREAESRRRPY